MALSRARAILEARKYIRKDISAGQWIRSMKELGLSYRRTTMLGDYRSTLNIEKKKGAMRFVRKDYYPAKAAIAEVEWALSKEYMYKVKVESRLRPDEPLVERFVNIMSDTPMTSRMVEAEVEVRWGEWEKYAAEELVTLQTWTAVHRVMQ